MLCLTRNCGSISPQIIGVHTMNENSADAPASPSNCKWPLCDCREITGRAMSRPRPSCTSPLTCWATSSPSAARTFWVTSSTGATCTSGSASQSKMTSFKHERPMKSWVMSVTFLYSCWSSTCLNVSLLFVKELFSHCWQPFNFTL